MTRTNPKWSEWKKQLGAIRNEMRMEASRMDDAPGAWNLFMVANIIRNAIYGLDDAILAAAAEKGE